MKTSHVVTLKGHLSPLEEYFRRFDIGKANWGTSEYINYSTTKVSPHFLKHALTEDFIQRYKEKTYSNVHLRNARIRQIVISNMLRARTWEKYSANPWT